jgi:uncharacterized RDD family membrane protein YckC
MSIVAGWYPDPENPHAQRWWDGSAWTEHTQLAESPGAPQPGGVHHGAGQPKLASQWLRLAARIIDGLLTGIVIFVCTLPWLGGYLDLQEEFSAVAASGGTADPMSMLTDPRYLAYITATTVAGLVVTGAYEVTMTKLKGATLGKLALGLRIRPLAAEAAGLSWGQALVRWAVMIVPSYACGLWGFVDSLWCLWDPTRQCVHDKPAKTLVVTTRG